MRRESDSESWVHEDKHLVDQMLDGDRQCFEEFFEDLAPRLFRFVARRVTGDAEAVPELVQSTLCIAIDKLENYRGEAAVFTWVCGICRHQISAHYRRKKVTPFQVELTEDSLEIRGALESLCLAPTGPDEALRRNEVADLVHRTIDQLPTHYGRALEWKYAEGRTVAEIAQRLGVGPKAAESILTRSRVAFRDAFAELIGGTEQARA